MRSAKVNPQIIALISITPNVNNNVHSKNIPNRIEMIGLGKKYFSRFSFEVDFLACDSIASKVRSLAFFS